ncbi:hypothetical protein JCM10908_003950 [Rhodotorula pacifica]|uniref:cytochrome b5-like heme/steroid binding domain-containing protein n=1 Tax=Rhodotorula pacifica TaxID=1495444 RepID=UPI003177E289
MGWFTREQQLPTVVDLYRKGKEAGASVGEVEHLEVARVAPHAADAADAPRIRQGRRHRGLQPAPLPEDLEVAAGGREPVDPEHLPFISPEVVAEHDNAEDGFWIIVEDRIYDCTDFLDLHPGGPEVFAQFGGRQCTWQFWKWHTKRQLEEWSPALLIGRTFPIPPNPYPEPRRWIKTGKI